MLGEHHSPSKAGCGESPWPSSCRTLASCPTKPSRYFACAPCAVWNWASSQVDLADLLGVRNETISRWWTAYGFGPTGIDCLPGVARTGRPQGTGRLLSDSPRPTASRALIDDNSPEKLGLNHPLWTRQRRPRADPQGVPHRPGGANGRPVHLRRWGYDVQEAPGCGMPASKIPTRSRSGCTRSTRPSKPQAATGGCGDPVDRRRSAWRRTTSPVLEVRAA